MNFINSLVTKSNHSHKATPIIAWNISSRKAPILRHHCSTSKVVALTFTSQKLHPTIKPNATSMDHDLITSDQPPSSKNHLRLPKLHQALNKSRSVIVIIANFKSRHNSELQAKIVSDESESTTILLLQITRHNHSLHRQADWVTSTPIWATMTSPPLIKTKPQRTHLRKRI